MLDEEKEILNTLPKEHLIYLIERLYNSQFLIGEACVEQSKCHIDSEMAVGKIRNYIYDMPSMYDTEELKAYLDMKMNKISVEEYRKIIGLD